MTNRAQGWAAAAILSLGLLGPAPAAGAAPQDYVGRTPPTVVTDPAAPKVLGRIETRGAATGDPIPITGSDVAGLTVAGLAAVATGTVLLRRGRRAPG